jgi:hypothetical protein
MTKIELSPRFWFILAVLLIDTGLLFAVEETVRHSGWSSTYGLILALFVISFPACCMVFLTQIDSSLPVLCVLGIHMTTAVDPQRYSEWIRRHYHGDQYPPCTNPCITRICGGCTWSDEEGHHQIAGAISWQALACTRVTECGRCGWKEERHRSDWGEWTHHAECTERRTCRGGCGLTEDRHALGNWGQWIAASSCVERRTCTRQCGASEVRTTHEWKPCTYWRTIPGWNYETCCGPQSTEESGYQCRNCFEVRESEPEQGACELTDGVLFEVLR